MKGAVPLAKNILIPLVIAGITWFWNNFNKHTLIISNEEMNIIMKIVQALKDSNILLKGVTKKIENETKEQKGGFLSMLLYTMGASLLGNVLSGKRATPKRQGRGIVRAKYGAKRASFRLKSKNSDSTSSFNKF